MANTLVGFKEYNGKKSDLINVTIESGDIVFGIDSETNLPYIYHNNVFYSDASEWSEALPEIHIGPTMPPEKDSYIKLWIDTDDNPPTLKYKNSYTNDWEDVSSNIDITETNEIFIGDNLPADISDNVKVWYQTNVDLPEEDIVVSWEDVENKPTFAEIAFTGSYTDLKDIPDTIKKTYYAHGQIDETKYLLTDEQLIDNINTQKSIENKEKANYIIHVVDTDKYYSANKVLQEESYVTLYAVVFEDDDNDIGNNSVNPIVTSVKLNIHNGEILEGIPNGGSGKAFVDSAYLSTKGYVTEEVTSLSNEIVANEEVTAAALNDLNKRVFEVIPLVDHLSSETTAAISPNIYHRWGEMSSLALTLIDSTKPTIYNEYIVEFKSGATATDLTLPTGLSYFNGDTPIIEANSTYQVSIVNGLCIIAKFV